MKRVFAWLAPVLAATVKWIGDPETVLDVALVGSIAAISYGASQVYRPAGYLAGGIIVLLLVMYTNWKVRK